MAKKILIVEDEEDILQMLSEAFRELAQYKIIYARDGKEALEISRVDKPDLILLDMHLPKLNGYEVCELVKSDPIMSHTKVIMLSGMTQTFDYERAMIAGADEYITKPFSLHALITKVEELLSNV